MFGRIACTSLLLITAFVPRTGAGQSPMGAGSYPPGGAPNYFYTPQGDYASGGYTHGRGQVAPGGTIYEELPDDGGWLYEEGPLGHALQEVFRHAYFRAEYLNWSISDPGDTLVSGPSGAVDNSPNSSVLPPYNNIDYANSSSIRRPFAVTAPDGNVATAIAPVLSDMRINNNNGVRGTFGLEWEPGTLEASVFTLETNNTEYDAASWMNYGRLNPTGPQVQRVIAQFSGQGGVQNGAIPLISDLGYQATLKSQLWGSEANFVWRDRNPNDNFDFRPLAGFRYLNFNESFKQRGQYSSVDDTVIPSVLVAAERSIDSYTRNNLYGPQIGFKAELLSKWFVLGVEPKIMLGVNTWKAGLSTDQVFSPTDIQQSIVDKETTFGPVADLEAYSRVNLTQSFSLYVSYNFMWAGMVTRPYENIVYNGTTNVPPTSAFQQDVHYSDIIVQGLGVGGELRY